MKIYHNPRCRKSRETLAILKEKGADFEVVEYLKNTPTKDELKMVLSLLQVKPIDIIRKGESIFKEQFKGKDFSDEEWLNILIENPKLIERPIVITEKQAVIGRPPENVNVLFS